MNVFFVRILESLSFLFLIPFHVVSIWFDYSAVLLVPMGFSKWDGWEGGKRQAMACIA